jgi:hypothetical protein
MNSFYVTLPSNSSMGIYPNNTLTSFKVKLNSAIHLDGNYEVALTEIMFPYNWKYRRDATLIAYDSTAEPAKRKYESFSVNFYSYQTIMDLLNSMNDFMKARGILLSFNYHRVSNKVSMTLATSWTVEFTDGLHKELGFKTQKVQSSGPDKQKTFYGTEKVHEQLNPINSIYVYTNIVNYQYVGDSYSPLLRVVAVDNRPTFGEYISKTFTSRDYIPVSKQNIETIEVELKSDSGESIQFGSGKVVLKLHFKPSNGF